MVIKKKFCEKYAKLLIMKNSLIILGLDPAGPLFKDETCGSRICKNDARNVEIIHTSDILGDENPSGHADFYPNRGDQQKGCYELKFIKFCSHSRAYSYFAESITSGNRFCGKNCTDPNKISNKTCNGDVMMMGGLKQRITKNGTFYLKTKDSAPYVLKPYSCKYLKKSG